MTRRCLDCDKVLTGKPTQKKIPGKPQGPFRCKPCAQKRRQARNRALLPPPPARTPLCVGYIRAHPTCGQLKIQRDIIREWYWKHAREYEWLGFWGDSQRTGESRLAKRKKIQGLIKRLKKDDLMLVPRFGILCTSLWDAVDGLPALLGQGIRIQLVADNFELKLEHLHFIRVLMRDWYWKPQLKKPRKCKIPELKELKFMQFCYVQSVVVGLPTHEIARIAKHAYPVHPRIKSPVSPLHVERAINLYHDMLANIWMGCKPPAWVEHAQQQGYLLETTRGLSVSRAAEFHNLVKPS
jgi:hypothetical protein